MSSVTTGSFLSPTSLADPVPPPGCLPRPTPPKLSHCVSCWIIAPPEGLPCLKCLGNNDSWPWVPSASQDSLGHAAVTKQPDIRNVAEDCSPFCELRSRQGIIQGHLHPVMAPWRYVHPSLQSFTLEVTLMAPRTLPRASHGPTYFQEAWDGEAQGPLVALGHSTICISSFNPHNVCLLGEETEAQRC